MPDSSPPTAPPPPVRPRQPAPFLLWPVSRREFYSAIAAGLVPSLAWGAILFGVRAFLMIACSWIGATAVHTLLRRAPWRRGRLLLYSHTLAATFILVALANPTWPVWTVASAAIILPVLLLLVGGPGRERVHVAVLLVLLIQLAVLPNLARTGTYAGGPDGILARDRLFMGDIREQRTALMNPWPSSRELGGSDAIHIVRPARTVAELYDALSQHLHDQPEAFSQGLTPQAEQTCHALLAQAFAFRLPGIDVQLLGAVPGRIGVVSLITTVVAGLYLGYRYVLRPRSVVIFLATFFIASAALAFWPSALARVGPIGLWSLVSAFPGELFTLANYFFLNSDACFAAVFILALPRTEPLTAAGRRNFLLLAAVAGAALHRLEPGVPAATLTLCVLMPAAPLFDRLFGQRSWLNVRR